MTDCLLLHPPLLGPAILGPLAAELRSRGYVVAVPDVRVAVATAPQWWARYTAAAAATGPADVVVGFSGAGAVLPMVAAAVGSRRVVWLDAIVPARSGATVPSAEMRELVAGFRRDGRLARWTTWWGPGAMVELLPDPVLRAAVEAETPELPGDFYDHAVPVPDTWPDVDVRYVQLSAGYDADGAEARARRWTVVGGPDGDHLGVATRPATVADLLAPTPDDVFRWIGAHRGGRVGFEQAVADLDEERAGR